MNFSLSAAHLAVFAGVAEYTLRSYEQAPPERLRATGHLFAMEDSAAAQAVGDEITHGNANHQHVQLALC